MAKHESCQREMPDYFAQKKIFLGLLHTHSHIHALLRNEPTFSRKLSLSLTGVFLFSRRCSTFSVGVEGLLSLISSNVCVVVAEEERETTVH